MQGAQKNISVNLREKNSEKTVYADIRRLKSADGRRKRNLRKSARNKSA
jgi:hypothetical protein